MPALPTVILQASTNSTAAAAPQGTALWVVAVELVVAVSGIIIVGTLLTRVFRSIALRSGASRAVRTSIAQWMGVLILIGVVAAVTTITGLSSQLTALTASGIAGLAASLALQSTISNVIAGVLLQRDGVVRLGDEVQFGGVRGVVLKLSLRTTWLRTEDGAIVVIGNNNLSGGPILNYTSRKRVEKGLEV